MGDVPTTTNKVATIVEDVLSVGIEGIGGSVIEGLIFADSAPILAIPIVGFFYTIFVRLIVLKFSKYFYRGVAGIIVPIIIDAQIAKEESKTTAAFQVLQMAVASGDQTAIKKASEDLDAAYGNIIHSDGWASIG